MNNRINKNEFKKAFLEKFTNYEEWNAIKNKNTRDCLFFIDKEHCKQVTIQFLSATKKYLYTIYVNADKQEENDFIINYFKELKIDKKIWIHDVFNDKGYFL